MLYELDFLGTVSHPETRSGIGSYSITVKFYARSVWTVIGDSSVASWIDKLNNQSIIVRNNQLYIHPPVRQDYRNIKLNSLLDILENDVIEDIKEQTETVAVTVFGAKLQALTVLYMAPLVVLILMYLFAGHVIHLLELSGDKTTSFKEIPWLPLMHPTKPSTWFLAPFLKLPLFGVIGAFMSVVILPSGVLILLYAKLIGVLSGYAMIMIVLCISVFATLWIGYRAWYGIIQIRRHVFPECTRKASTSGSSRMDSDTLREAKLRFVDHRSFTLLVLLSSGVVPTPRVASHYLSTSHCTDSSLRDLPRQTGT